MQGFDGFVACGQLPVVAAYDGKHQRMGCAGPRVGHAVFQFLVAPERSGGLRHVADDMAGGVEHQLKARVELAAVEPRHLHAAAEHRELRGKRGRQRFACGIKPERPEQMGHERVNLVVGPGGVSGKLYHAHVGGLDVEGHGAHVVIHMQGDVARIALRAWDISANQSGEIAADHLHHVAILKVDVVEREVRQTVPVSAGYVHESGHTCVVNHGITILAAAVDKKREPVWADAELLDLGKGSAHEHVVER